MYNTRIRTWFKNGRWRSIHWNQFWIYLLSHVAESVRCSRLIFSFYDSKLFFLIIRRGILFVFWGGFLCFFLLMTERKSHVSARSATQQLVFKRDVKLVQEPQEDSETGPLSRNGGSGSSSPTVGGVSDALPPSKCIFSWHHLNYDVQLSFGKYRRLLNDVSGYVIPGKLVCQFADRMLTNSMTHNLPKTALMGESGAGKTTLLNALAERLPAGVITGDRFINGQPVPYDFSGKTGYCQQMDIHLETTSIREALRFSAVLRQPASVSKKEKYD